MTTIVHDTTEAVCLCGEFNLYLKPIAKMTISVALPQLKMPGKSISNWEVMERVKAMVAPEQFSALRISKSTMDFIRFEGEVENKGVVKSLLSRLDGKSIKLSGFTDILKVRLLSSWTHRSRFISLQVSSSSYVQKRKHWGTKCFFCRLPSTA